MKTDQPMRRLLSDLRELSEPDTHDEQLRALVRERLLAPARPAPATVRLRPRRRLRARFGLAAALAAALATALALSVVLVGGTGRASAETVLRRAAAVRLGANEGAHFTYSVQTTLSGRTGTGEVWIESDAGGAPTLVAEAVTLAKDPASPPMMVERVIETPAGIYSYDVEHNVIIVSPRDDPNWATRGIVALPPFLFNGAWVAQRLQELVQSAHDGARLLGQQTIDGVSVDAVEVDGWPNDGSRTTFYFDVDSHLLRGFDVVNTDPSSNAPSFRVRLSRHETLAVASLPEGTFKLNAPDAVVELASGNALARLCPGFSKQALVQGKTLLQICQSTKPGLTEDELIAALSASAKSDLDAAVADGQITAAQAAAGLAAQKAQLEESVTASTPVAKIGRPPTPTAPTASGK